MTYDNLKRNFFTNDHVKNKKLPISSGVYLLYKKTEYGKQILYIGSTRNFQRRISTHFLYRRCYLLSLKEEWCLKICFIRMDVCFLSKAEKLLIDKHMPVYNVHKGRKFIKSTETEYIRNVPLKRNGHFIINQPLNTNF